MLNARRKTILVGEDEPEVSNYLELAFRCGGYDVEIGADGEEVLAYLHSGNPAAAVILDIIMPRKDGLETLREIRTFNQDIPVVMVSGAAMPLNIVEAMRAGATDFLSKPVSHEDLQNALKKALASGSADSRLSLSPEVESHFESLPSASQSMRELGAMIVRVGRSEEPVLIHGETGAGKEVLAKQLHAASPRANKPFIKVNCAALPSELVESELFGYERGAFTGAFQRKPGMFALADGGTIMLDEIGDMDVDLQAKLLQVLQDQEFHPLGGKEPVRVDVRVIAATHRDLDVAIANGSFRQDLYYRLNVITLRVPPLRERKADIIPLAESLLREHAKGDQAALAFPAELKQALIRYEWPGNVRELGNIVRKFVVLQDAQMIIRELRSRASRIAPSDPPVGNQLPIPETATTILEQVNRTKEKAETDAIIAALNAARWNRKKAARNLNIDYKALLYKMKKLSIEERASGTAAC